MHKQRECAVWVDRRSSLVCNRCETSTHRECLDRRQSLRAKNDSWLLTKPLMHRRTPQSSDFHLIACLSIECGSCTNASWESDVNELGRNSASNRPKYTPMSCVRVRVEVLTAMRVSQACGVRGRCGAFPTSPSIFEIVDVCSLQLYVRLSQYIFSILTFWSKRQKYP